MRVLVTGGSGFVGRHVLAALRRAPQPPALRLLAHQSPVDGGPKETVPGDLAAPATLAAACRDVDVVVHLASYIGDDEATCDAVNARGTAALVAEAGRRGVTRMLYLSSAAVYGYAVHREASEHDTVVAPATPVSRSRARAEAAVLGAGGVVLRPLFVYGDGDTRFIPVLARALDRLPFLPDGGRARLSVIAVDDLASAIAALALRGWSQGESGAYHATDGHPVALRALARALAATFGTRAPRLGVPYPVARWIVRLAAATATGGQAWTPSAAHRLFLVSRDHCYDGSRLRALTALPPSQPLVARLAEFAPWYTPLLAARAEPEAA